MGEQIVVVKSSVIDSFNFSDGIVPLPYETILKVIENLNLNYEVIDRDLVEGDPSYRQLIPYVTIVCGDKYFSATRTKEGGDPRLHGKRIVGFGGHMNILNSTTPELFIHIRENAQRELEEELIITDSVDMELCGFINDLSTPVSRDHFGIYIKANIYTQNVFINETSVLVDSSFLSKEELLAYPNMENWSKLVLSVL